jgi:hypothetical protein
MNTTEIELALYDHFRFLQNDVMTNIYLDYGRHECDLIVIRNQSLYALEVEIKMSISDLKAERKKQRYQNHGVNCYHHSSVGMSQRFKEKWFAMPEKMKQKGLALIPEYAGLLTINKDGAVKIARKAKKLNNQPLTQGQRIDLLRLGVMKCYNLKQRIVSAGARAGIAAHKKQRQ